MPRARGQELGKGKHQGDDKGGSKKGGDAHDNVHDDNTDAEMRSYFCLAIVSTHSTRRDATPSASHCSSDTLLLRRAMAAPGTCTRCDATRNWERVGWLRRAYGASSEKDGD